MNPGCPHLHINPSGAPNEPAPGRAREQPLTERQIVYLHPSLTTRCEKGLKQRFAEGVPRSDALNGLLPLTR
jgi:hypothetical protein